MGVLDYFELDTLLFRAIAFVLLITLHDCLLAWAAKRLGDPAAAEQGRVSFNPGRHLDPLGTLMVLFGPYGWSRPMAIRQPVESQSGKLVRAAAVYAAGPLIYALIAVLSSWWFLSLPDMGGGSLTLLWTGILQYISITATLLAIMNLIPLYPMDAWRLVRSAVSGETGVKLAAKEKWLLIFWVALLTLPFGRNMIEAVYRIAHSWITSVLPL
ncbi:site-2 protease family protein [Paenibacillus senegalensis]|uniref:site-2 protease family protein n=1 Tax=Paenibacillus senegalensis TaxID=1465766 RepID=UPI000289CD0F|nr:site-2 protease family protein [Paenibacillus senegalensis]